MTPSPKKGIIFGQIVDRKDKFVPVYYVKAYGEMEL